MTFKCTFGFHTWDGCKCSGCNKTRNEQHTWEGCKCSKCGGIRDEQHDWSQGCEKCAICGKSRVGGHTWAGCKCSKCGIIRDQDHDWSITYKCKKCGKSAPKRIIDKALNDGVTKGSQQLVTKALDAGADFNQEIEFLPKRGSFAGLEIGGLLEGLSVKKNLLKIAIENGHVDVARILIDRGASLKIEYGNKPWDEILLDAATKNHFEIASLALEQGANINSRGLHHTTPLILASMFGHLEMVKLLLNNGADLTSWSSDPSFPSRNDRTALMWANTEGHQEVVKMLKEAGAQE